ncbi:EAL domain-containing protein [Sphingomonas populi]|uniref:EAL domain-containing protein n=1 Tax=Sphingomonas populi TaxID=2484750 RepID=A0A4Q6XZ19_9SPHN|nr:EAL domain-containing protein [Sphingomonas populi]RZF66133.1 EAL domain-containing protein [Sphingomonas populi]
MARALQIQHVFGASTAPHGGLLSERGEARAVGLPIRDTTNGGYRRPLAAGSDAPVAILAWQGIVLAEVANFAGLRRHLGRPRADRLVLDLIDRASDWVPGIRSLGAGRTVAEFELGGIDLAAIEATVEVLRTAFDSPFDLDGELHRVEILLAAAAAPVGSTEDVRLVEEAEGALEQARIELCTVVRDLSDGTPAFDRLSLIRELPAAIANGEMFLQYQPKVHVRRQAISSAEALIRWQHPRRGLILPGDFITIAEEARQISALTLWTLDQVIADQKTLRGDGRDLTIFINISGQLLGDAEFVAEACHKVGAGGVRIGFEITETAVIRDPQSAIANLCRFDDVGITIAIDDYGAGLSSLAYLKQLPARELKIDKMFILQLTSSNRDPLIVRSTIDLAHALEMEVTAEGVETQAALALLSVMGCDMVQGYLISRPVSIEAFRQFLRDDNLQLGGDLRQSMFKRPASFWRTG